MAARAAGRGCCAGYSLVEVLVAMLLLSFGVLATAAALSHAVAAGRASGHRAVAVMLAAEAAEMMRANSAAAYTGAYTYGAFTPEAAQDIVPRPCGFPTCTAASLAAFDLDMLRQRVRDALPAGRVEISAPAATEAGGAQADVWIIWTEPPMAGQEDGAVTGDVDPCPPTASRVPPLPRCLYTRVAL